MWYDYKNDNDEVIELQFSAKDAPDEVTIEGCRYVKQLNFGCGGVVVKSSDNRDKSANKWPMASVAAGVAAEQVPDQMAEDRRKGVGGTDYTADGNPIFTSPGHRKRYCEAHGLYDKNAGYGDPTPKNRTS